GKKVLDLGCGPGLYGKEFVKRGYEYWGVDISPEVIEEAKRAVKKVDGETMAHFMVSDIENLDLPPKTFDIVIASWVLEFLETDSKAIKQIRRVLKSGGTAIVVLNNVRSYNRVVRKLTLDLFKKFPPGFMTRQRGFQHFRIRYHDPQEFRKEMKAAGFS